MGHFDKRNYVIEVKLRDNVSDRRFDALRKTRPTIKEYKSLESRLLKEHPVYNSMAEKLVRFFIEYKDGLIKPDRYNFFEPIKNIFDENDISEPIRMIASPGGGVYLKKNRCMCVEIMNLTHSFVWCDNVYMPPQRPLPEYLTIITISFSKKRNTDLGFIIQLMKDIKESFGADNGKVYYQATNEVIAE